MKNSVRRLIKKGNNLLMWHSFIFRVKLGIQSDSDVQRFAVTAGSHCEHHGFIAATLRARARRGTAFNLAEF